jgi:hypothetical protein
VNQYTLFLTSRIKRSAAGRIAKLPIKLVAFMARNHRYRKLKAMSDTINRFDVEALEEFLFQCQVCTDHHSCCLKNIF